MTNSSKKSLKKVKSLSKQLLNPKTLNDAKNIEKNKNVIHQIIKKSQEKEVSQKQFCHFLEVSITLEQMHIIMRSLGLSSYLYELPHENEHLKKHFKLEDLKNPKLSNLDSEKDKGVVNKFGFKKKCLKEDDLELSKPIIPSNHIYTETTWGEHLFLFIISNSLSLLLKRDKKTNFITPFPSNEMYVRERSLKELCLILKKERPLLMNNNKLRSFLFYFLKFHLDKKILVPIFLIPLTIFLVSLWTQKQIGSYLLILITSILGSEIISFLYSLLGVYDEHQTNKLLKDIKKNEKKIDSKIKSIKKKSTLKKIS